MFKNAIIYRIASVPSSLGIDEALCLDMFEPCGASQEKSIGWVPPRGEAHGALLEIVGGQWILRLMTETKAIPGDVIARKVKERVAQIEASTGRKPGKKETRDLKDDIQLELLPMAFTKQSAVLIWIDPQARWLVIDASSQARADEVVTMLVKSLPGLAVTLLNTQLSPTAAMSEWLVSQDPPAGFTVDRECELKAADESKAVVKYGRHPLDIDEVRAHVEGGKLPTRLALTWDSRVSFVLTEGLQLKKLAFLEVVIESGTGKGEDSGFDCDVAIATGELCKLIPDLLAALGGEFVAQEAPTLPSGITSVTIGGNPSHPDQHLGSHIDGPDPLYDKAVEVVLKNRKASISLVQRHLKIGYNRAARLLEDMEKSGVVRSMGANGARMVVAL